MENWSASRQRTSCHLRRNYGHFFKVLLQCVLCGIGKLLTSNLPTIATGVHPYPMHNSHLPTGLRWVQYTILASGAPNPPSWATALWDGVASFFSRCTASVAHLMIEGWIEGEGKSTRVPLTQAICTEEVWSKPYANSSPPPFYPEVPEFGLKLKLKWSKELKVPAPTLTVPLTITLFSQLQTPISSAAPDFNTRRQ